MPGNGIPSLFFFFFCIIFPKSQTITAKGVIYVKKHTLILSAAAILGISGVTCAYILTAGKPEINIKENAEADIGAEILKPLITSEPEAPPESAVEPIYYMLTAEANVLKLCEIDGENKKIVKTAEIMLDMLPKDDVELLKNGIHALSLEEGIEIMENFIS